MIEELRNKAKKIFCKHEYEKYKTIVPFHKFNGIEVKCVCKRCGKVTRNYIEY